ncbi:MAG: N-acetylneuraminate synthase family protein [Elusimicrobia bacterium]|nr:N-acetylneuraminate synthase family protein [Elusimicrobiota bacterium]
MTYKRELKIGNFIINDESDCFVVAEIGHNHQGSIEQAKKLFDAAKEAGAQAVKLQKRHNKTLYTKALYNQPYDNENSFGPTYGLHREALEFNKEQYQELQKYAKRLGLVFFATAFDFKSADFLAELDMPVYKIASGDVTNVPLLKYVAKIQKPIILSTGAASLDDVRRAHEAIMPINRRLAILQCTAGYPAKWEELNLNVIENYKKSFPDIVIGFSAHDNGIAMPVAAYVLGARIIEKHFTLNRAMKGTDHAFSLEPVGLRKMIRDLKRVRVALGDGVKRPSDSEKPALIKMGKTLVAGRKLPKGAKLAGRDVAIKSPGAMGLAPYFLDQILGRRLSASLKEDEPILFKHLEQ